MSAAAANGFDRLPVLSSECTVCQDFYTNPRILTCGHSYCSECIAKIIRSQPRGRKARCPICQAEISLPSGGLDNLPINYALRSVLQEITTDQRPSRSKCVNHNNDNGNESRVAVIFCRGCSSALCADCTCTHSHKCRSRSTLTTIESAVEQESACMQNMLSAAETLLANLSGVRHEQADKAEEAKKKFDADKTEIEQQLTRVNGELERLRESTRNRLDKAREAAFQSETRDYGVNEAITVLEAAIGSVKKTLQGSKDISVMTKEKVVFVSELQLARETLERYESNKSKGKTATEQKLKDYHGYNYQRTKATLDEQLKLVATNINSAIECLHTNSPDAVDGKRMRSLEDSAALDATRIIGFLVAGLFLFIYFRAFWTVLRSEIDDTHVAFKTLADLVREDFVNVVTLNWWGRPKEASEQNLSNWLHECVRRPRTKPY